MAGSSPNANSKTDHQHFLQFHYPYYYSELYGSGVPLYVGSLIIRINLHLTNDAVKGFGFRIPSYVLMCTDHIIKELDIQRQNSFNAY